MDAFEVVCRRRSQRFVADCGKMDSLRAAPKMVELGEKILPSAVDTLFFRKRCQVQVD